jgi:hypothetical protein
MQLLFYLLSVAFLLGAAAEQEKSENRELFVRPAYSYAPKLPTGLSLVNGKCVYKVKSGDALIKIANTYQQFLAFPRDENGKPTKDCLQCPGYPEQCAIPTWQNGRSGHLGDYIQLWQANGACSAGKNDANRIKVGDTLIIPNCPLSSASPTVAPTRKQPTRRPTRRPTRSPTKLRGPPAEHVETDDAFDHVVKAVKDKVREWVGTATPTPKPSKAKKTPKPTYKAPLEDDEYYTA